MFDKLKDLGDQIGTLASDTVETATTSVKQGTDKVVSVTETATSIVTEKAVRTAVGRLRSIVRIATDELLREPPSERPATLTATVTIGITSLELMVEIPGGPSTPETEAPVQLTGEGGAAPQ
jgi:hypothetical protein